MHDIPQENSVDAQKWASLQHELSKLCASSDIHDTLQDLAWQCSAIPLHQPDNRVSPEFSENERITIHNNLLSKKFDASGVDEPPPHSLSALINALIRFINHSEHDSVLSRALQSQPLIKKYLESKREDRRRKEEVAIEESSSDVSGLIRLAYRSNSQRGLVVLIKVLLFIWETRPELFQAQSLLSSSLLQLYLPALIPDSSYFHQILQYERHVQTMSTFQSLPRILPVFYQPEKLGHLEVRGSCVGVISDLIALPHSGQYYYEATLRSATRGLLLGWCSSTVTTQLGCDTNSWCFDGHRNLMFYDEVNNSTSVTAAMEIVAEQQTGEQEAIAADPRYEIFLHMHNVGVPAASIQHRMNIIGQFTDVEIANFIEHLPATTNSATVDARSALRLPPSAPAEDDVFMGFADMFDETAAAEAAVTGGIKLAEKSTPWSSDDIVGLLLDTDNMCVRIFINHVEYGNPAFSNIVMDTAGWKPAFASVTSGGFDFNVSRFYSWDEKKRDTQSSCLRLNSHRASVPGCVNIRSSKLNKVSDRHSYSLEISALLRLADVDKSADMYTLFHLYNSHSDLHFVLKITKSLKVQFQVISLTHIHSYTSKKSVIKDRSWYQYSITFSSTKESVHLYLNGQMINLSKVVVAAESTPKQYNESTMNIGMMLNGSSPFAGDVCDIRVWADYKAEPEIVNNLGRAVLTGTEKRLLCYWRCSERCGSMLYDSGVSDYGMQAHGAITGDVSWGSFSTIVKEESFVSVNMVDAPVRCDTVSLHDFTYVLLKNVCVSTEQMVRYAASQSYHMLQSSCIHADVIVDPHVFNFLALNSCLRQLLRMASMQSCQGDLIETAVVSLLRIVRLNLLRIKLHNLSPSSFGLKYPSQQREKSEQFVTKLLNTLLIYASDSVPVGACVSEEALRAIIEGYHVFFPTVYDKVAFMNVLLFLKHRPDDIDTPFAKLSLDVSALDVVQLPTDPYAILLHFSPNALHATMKALCKTMSSMLQTPQYAGDLIRSEVRPIYAVSMNRLLRRPKDVVCIGDVASRGPDWSYGDQDGNDYGTVIGVSPYQNVATAIILVEWKDNTVNSYCYGIVVNGVKRYDLTIYYEGSGEEKEQNSQETKDSERKVLSYSPDEVRQSLADEIGSLTKRSVLRYMKSVAPSHWLNRHKLNWTENTLVNKLSVDEIIALYSTFYSEFARKSDVAVSQQSVQFSSSLNIFCQNYSYDDLFSTLLKLLIRDTQSGIVGNQQVVAEVDIPASPLPESEEDKNDVSVMSDLDMGDDSSGYSLLTQVQDVLLNVPYLLTQGGGSLQYFPSSSRLVKKSTLNSCTILYNWQDNTWQKEQAADATGNYARLDNLRFNVENIRNLSVSDGGISIRQRNSRKWSTCLGSIGIQPNTGKYEWCVRINNLGKRGHCIIGVATEDIHSNTYLGQDINGWGMTLNNEIYHDSVRKSTMNTTMISAGSVLRLVCDSDAHTLTINIIETESQVNDMYSSVTIEHLANTKLYPAFSLFSPGDTLSLLPSSMDALDVSSRTIGDISAVGYPSNMIICFAEQMLTMFLSSLSRDAVILTHGISLNVVQLVTILTRWKHVAESDVKRLLSILNQILPQLRCYCDKNDATTPMATQLLSVVCLLIGKLTSLLIDKQPVYHNFDILVEACKSNVDDDSAESIANSEKWLIAPLLSCGLVSKNVHMDDSAALLGVTPSGESRQEVLINWMMRNDKTANSIKHIGGGIMMQLTKTLFNVALYHGGYVNASSAIADCICSCEATHVPFAPYFIRLAWNAAINMRMWAMQLHQRNSTSYEKIGCGFLRKLTFLLAIIPSQSEKEAGSFVSNLFSPQPMSVFDQSYYNGLEKEFQLVIDSIIAFMKDDISVCYLNVVISATLRKAALRQCGFDFLTASLHHLLNAHGWISKLCLLIYFPLSMRQESTSKNHYLDDLLCCHSEVTRGVRGAFEGLIQMLAGELSSASYRSDSRLVILLLNCLGLTIREEDHDLLVRVNVFYVLQDVLESASAASDSMYQVITIAAMKVVYLLALQIAAKKESRASNAPQLVRARSGPSTLSNAVFDMLYNQLRNIMEPILYQYCDPLAYVSADRMIILEEATLLLDCVSRTPSCQKILMRANWLTLLIDLSLCSPVLCQQRCFRVLMEILPLLQPIDIDVGKSDISVALRPHCARYGVSSEFVSNSESLIALFVNMCAAFSYQTENSMFVVIEEKKSNSFDETKSIASECIALLRRLSSCDSWSWTTDKVYNALLHNTSSRIGVLNIFGGFVEECYRGCTVSVLVNERGKIQEGVVVSAVKHSDVVDVLLSGDTVSTTCSIQKVIPQNRYPLNSVKFSDPTLGLLLKTAAELHYSPCDCNGPLLSSSVVASRAVISLLSCPDLQPRLVQQMNDLNNIFSRYLCSLLLKSIQIVDATGFADIRVLESYLSMLLTYQRNKVSSRGQEQSIATEAEKPSAEAESKPADGSQSLFPSLQSSLPRSLRSDDRTASRRGRRGQVITENQINIWQAALSSEDRIDAPDMQAGEWERMAQQYASEQHYEDMEPDEGEDVELVEDVENRAFLVEQLEQMGFPNRWCEAALALCGYDLNDALNYILANGDALETMVVEDNQPLSGEDASVPMEESKEDVGSEVCRAYHFNTAATHLTPIYKLNSATSEKIGCLKPGDNVTSVCEVMDEEGNEWIELSDGGWVPIRLGEETIMIKGTAPLDAVIPDLLNPPCPLFEWNATFAVTSSTDVYVTADSNDVITQLPPNSQIKCIRETFLSDCSHRVEIVEPVAGWVVKSAENITFEGSAEKCHTDWENLQTIEDRMELWLGGDSFRKEERYFGRNTDDGNTHNDRLYRIMEAHSYLMAAKEVEGYSLNTLSKKIARVVEILQVLYSRQALLGWMLTSLQCESVAPFMNLLISEVLTSFSLPCRMSNSVAVKNSQSLLVVRCAIHELYASHPALLTFVADLLTFIKLVCYRSDTEHYIFRMESFALERVSKLFIRHNQLPVENIIMHVLSMVVVHSNAALSRCTIDCILSLIAKELALATGAAYVDHNWSRLAYEGDTDEETMRSPNIHFIQHLTSVILQSECEWAVYRLCEMWCIALRSSSMSLNTIAFAMLAAIVIKVQESFPTAVNNYMTLFPISQLELLSARRLWYEMEDNPAYSRYLNGLLHLLSLLRQHSAASDSDNDSKTLKFVAKEGSHVHMMPSRELRGPWTVEAWVYITKTNDVITSDAVEPPQPIKTPQTPPMMTSAASTLPSSARFGMPQLHRSRSNTGNDEAPAEPSHPRFELSELLISDSIPGGRSERFGLPFNRSPAEIARAIEEFGMIDEVHLLDFPGGYSDARRLPLSRNEGAPLLASPSRLSRPGTAAPPISDAPRSPSLRDRYSRPPRKIVGEAAPLPTKTTKTTRVTPAYLLYSPSYFIKLQAGGIVSPDVDDPEQASDYVPDKAYCMSIGIAGETDKYFDYVLPTEKWVHIAICSRKTNSVTLFADGEFIQSITTKMYLPLSHIGSSQANESFNGYLAAFRVWNTAQSQREIQRNSTIDYAEHKNLLCKLSFRNGRVVDDVAMASYKCKNCLWSETPSISFCRYKYPPFTVKGTEVSDGLYGEGIGDSVGVVEYVGVLRFKEFIPLLSDFVGWDGQVIHLCYRVKEGTSELEGFIEWSELETRSYITGTINESSLSFTIPRDGCLLGSLEKMEWVQEMQFVGTIEKGRIICDVALRTVVHERLPLKQGERRIDDQQRPRNVSIIQSNDNETVALESCARSAAVLITVASKLHACQLTEYPQFPSIRSDEDVERALCEYHDKLKAYYNGSVWDTIDMNRQFAYELCKNQGCLWIEWTINRVVEPVVIGVCTMKYVISTNPHPDTLSDSQDNWSYHSKGVISHGKKQFTCSNYKFRPNDIISIEIDTHQCRIAFYRNYTYIYEYDISKHPSMTVENNTGVRPFVMLTSTEDSVSLRSVSPERPGLLFPRALHIKYPATDMYGRKELYSQLLFDSITGRGILTCLHSDGIWVGHWNRGVQHGVQLWITLNLEKTAYSHIEPFYFENGVNLRKLSVHEATIWVEEWNTVLSRYYELHSASGEDSLHVPVTSSDGESKEDTSSYVEMKQQTINIALEVLNLPKLVSTPQSSPLYKLKIIYKNGATVRTGIEIDNSTAIRSLKLNDVVDAYELAHTAEGIPRYRLFDGWISEKLRGGSEETVVQILEHRPVVPIKYKVIRSGGAKVRADWSLDSSELCTCPMNTIIEVAEKRYIETDGGTMRIRIVAPQEYIGWASDKAHIVQVYEGSCQVSEELKRRQAIRRDRQMRGNKAPNNFIEKVVTVKGTLTCDQDTFFLFNKSQCNGGIKLSSDFVTATCESRVSGRPLVLGSRGFSKGKHYWEVVVDSAQWGSVFIGAAPADASNWNGYGFINYRATQNCGAETLYGSYYSAGDRVGVLLDMDHGTISFFKDGEDFNVGKTVVLNMGVAYHKLRRNHRASAAPALFPCVGLKSSGDQISLRNCRWASRSGVSASIIVSEIMRSRDLISLWHSSHLQPVFGESDKVDLYCAYCRWRQTESKVVQSRADIFVSIDIGISYFMELHDQHSHLPLMYPGMKLKTPYGVGRIIGSRINQIWYVAENDNSKAWFWKVEHFLDLINMGMINFDVENEVRVESMEEKLPIMEYDEFSAVLHETDWMLKDYVNLANLVNSYVDKFDVDPLTITAEELVAYRKDTSLLIQYSSSVIEAYYVLLCVFNKAVASTLPFLDFDSHFSLQTNFDAIVKKYCTPIQYSRSGDIFHDIKRLVFTKIKMNLWKLCLTETTEFTSPPPDEYERPEEISEIALNRMESHLARQHAETLSFEDRLSKSLFGQLLRKINSWDSVQLRKSFVHMLDAGQARAFYVKFTGEGVDDHGGPYRAVFQTAIGEEIGDGLLQLFVACANARNRIGESRDGSIMNPDYVEYQQKLSLYHHLGRLIGLACRHNILISLSLPRMIWKPLVGEVVTVAELNAVDSTMVNSLKLIEENKMSTTDIYDMLHQLFTMHRLPDSIITELLGPDGEAPPHVSKLCDLVRYYSLTYHETGLAELYRGLAEVVPVELLHLFTASELEVALCGEPEVDIDLLKRVTEYEGVSPTDRHIQYFWEALVMMSSSDRSKFINFCSGRSRLPASIGEFSMNFKLTSPPPQSVDAPDEYLPIAQTCFFCLSLPKYSSTKVCLQKLKYAIHNADLMDADFVMRNAVGWENIR